MTEPLMPKPLDIETNRTAVGCFGKYELEVVALHLTVASQKNANHWLGNFTVREFCKLTGWPRKHASDALCWLEMLAEDGWLDIHTTRESRWFIFTREVPCFSINKRFIERLGVSRACKLRDDFIPWD